jgi:TRAP-type C4-dicarboxylate transport system substrate-binding protein
MRVVHFLTAALVLLAPTASRAQTVWEMPTEYPQSAMPGLGVTSFARHLAEHSGGAIQIKPSFDAAAGIKSAAMLDAVATDKVQAGDAFAGALENEDVIFALPSLPFLVGSIDDAHRLADLARPFLAAALQAKQQRLLYLTPWPPSGVWSKTALKSPDDLAALSIRTYDKTSSEVFHSVGAKASSISYADTMPKLADGSITAVLSSGDGGAGRKLWQFLPVFTEINYSLPLSVASVNQKRYDALSAEQRAAVDQAGRQTEAELWLALSTRVQENYQRMRENGVTIDAAPAASMLAALKAAGAGSQQAWCIKATTVCQKIFEAYQSGKSKD